MAALRPLTIDSTKATPRVSYRLSDEGLVTFIGRQRHRVVYSFDVTRLSMFAAVPNSDQLKAKDILKLVYLTYLYTLRLANVKMIRRLTDVPYATVTTLRETVYGSVDLVRYKVATLRCVADRLSPDQPREVEAHFVACGLKREDAVLFYLCYYNADLPTFVAMVNEIPDARVVLDVDRFLTELDRYPTEYRALEKSAGVVAWRKLRFLANGNKMNPGDYQNDILARVLQHYRWIRPFYSVEHAVNYCKRTVDTIATDIIREAVKDPLKSRTIATGDGYDNVMRSYTDDLGFSGNPYAAEDAMVEYLDYTRRRA